MNQNILLLSLLVVFYSFEAVSKCAPLNDFSTFEKSKAIVVANFRSSDFKYDKKSVLCHWGQKKLSYDVEIEKVISGHISTGMYTLSYIHDCYTKPSNQIFDVPSKYILAVHSFEGKKLKLVGLMCNSWGWRIDKLEDVKKSNANFCNSKKWEIINLIKNSRKCSLDSECSYVSYMPDNEAKSSCHHFINSKFENSINNKIKDLEKGVCETDVVYLCKAPRKDFIKCKSGLCTFPI